MELSYEIRRSTKRKKLTITVERDRSVVVHAPANVSDGAVRQLVDKKRLWLFEKLQHEQKYQPLPHPPGKELVNGEAALYLGRAYRIELVDDSDGGIRFAGKFLIPRSHVRQRRQVLRQWYVERAREKILPRVCSQAHGLGVAFEQATINDSCYRWGSCTPGNNLHFNWRLIKAPMFVIDYVIVHELAHLIEANHTPRFWNIVRAQLTAMDRARDWLRDNGQRLEEDV
ncbi:M48 family metallopeptidase [Rhodanobacter ginsenosidimutans]|uniref:M48 family metallopeptidase n=1 Tax=Rhodanobacter ginsenosidimutans TaxID=490571 RepID=A0ABW0JV83_9GAMM